MAERFLDRDRLPMPLLLRMVVVLFFWVLVLHVLVLARNFLYPLALGLLFAFLLLPVASRLERLGITRILANLISIFLGIGVVYGVLLFIYRRLGDLLTGLPTLRSHAAQNVRTILDGVGARIGMDIDGPDGMALQESMDELLQLTGDRLGGILGATGNTLLTIGLMPVYVFMFLYYRDKFRRFVLMLVPDAGQKLARQVVQRIAEVTMRYMTGMFTVVLILAVVNSIGFHLIGLRYAVLMGVVAAICNFIPYFGTIVGYAIPFTFAFLTEPSPNIALGVLVQFFVVQFTENNVLTPNIVGGMLRINPFIIILGVIAGGMVWGLPGMFVVVPALGMMKVTCEHVPVLKPWAYLLGDKGTERHSLTGRKIRRFFTFPGREAREDGTAPPPSGNPR